MNEGTPHRCVLLTGATGFLGGQIAKRLLHETDLTIIALVHAENQAAATQRLSRAWWDWPELVTAFTTGHSRMGMGGKNDSSPHPAGDGEAAVLSNVRVEILSGNVSLPHLGLDEATYSRLAGLITHIIHTAADLRVDAPLDELRKTNVQGTANM
ncbi:MAG: SDR family oxidoreductase, partial [Chloroflexota bacterium]